MPAAHTRSLTLLLATAALAAGMLAPSAQAATGSPGAEREPVGRFPCRGVDAAAYRCPDLIMTKPYGMYAERSRGRLLLHGGNSIRNVGRGPLEVRASHDRRYSMTARQRIYRVGGGAITRPIPNRVVWKRIPGQGHYWKFDHAAALELWSIDSRGRRIAKVRTSPKLVYCLRDLKHPFPGLPRSPGGRHYPACSQRLGISGRTLGTSVGWSDDYPSSYHQQWIDVTGLRGRFAYVMRVDPLGSLYESDKTNNTNSVIVRLPPVNGRFLVGGAVNPPRDDGYDYLGYF